jgi:endonuclease YncB( thermonuclease family)
MRRVLVTAVLFCLGSFSSAYGWQGFVVKVLDGDSIRVKRGGKVVEVRLYGIDCPEWEQEYGDNARRYTKAKTYRKTVSVEPKDVDRYGRTVALVRRAGRLVNRELVRDGLAWMYPKYCKEEPLCSELKELEKKARARRRGLWQAKAPVSPWEWKRQKKSGPPPVYHRQYRYPVR